MSQPNHSLSNAARRVLAEVADQFDRQHEASRGVCAVVEVRETKHGAFGPASSVETEQRRLDDPGAEVKEDDLLPFVRGDGYDRSELPAQGANELRIRAERQGPGSAEVEVRGADLVFQKDPARLLRAELHAPALSGVAGFLMSATESSVTYEYVNGVPLVSEMRVRMRSRGVGRFRFDHEMTTSVRYEPCT